MRKAILLSAMLVFLFALVGAVNAQVVGPFAIDSVKIDNQVLSSTNDVYAIERTDQIEIEVWVRSNATITTDRVEVKAEIIGYEYGDITDETGVFIVKAGNNVYKKSLSLLIPDDIDAQEIYTLRITVVASNTAEVEQEFQVRIDEPRHFVKPFAVLVQPSSAVKAGAPVFVTVRAENLGSRKEEDIKVTASIPELGVSASNFIDELVTQLQEEAQRLDDNEESSDSINLILRLPEDAPTGNYNVNVVIEYNRGHDFATETKTIFVQGQEKVAVGPQAIVNVDSSSKDLTAGQETLFRLTLANLGDAKGVFSVELDGEDLWADSKVDPGFVSLEAGRTGEVNLYLKPKDGAKAGNYNFVARVMMGSNTVREVNLNARVVEQTRSFDDLKTVLAVVFIVLVVVLIVLALVLAMKKGNGKEPSTVEGQSYYYYPRQ